MFISYTFLKAYTQCHRKAKLQYIDKVVDRARINHRPFIVGIVVDWLFTKWISEFSFLDGWMEMKAEAMFRWFADRRYIIYYDDNDKENLIRRTVKAAELLQEASYELGLPDIPVDEIDTQKIIKFKGEPGFEEFEFFAKADLWFPMKHALWDLKITTQKKYMDEFQLRFYAWAFERAKHRVDSLAFLVPEVSPSFKEVEYDDSIKTDTDLEVIELLTALKYEEDWNATAKDCWGCPVKDHCDKIDATDMVAEKKEDGGFRVFIGEDIFK